MSTEGIITPLQPNPMFFETLYRNYGDELKEARQFIGAHCCDPAMRRQFDDLEAEALYLLIRAFKPEHLVEISPRDGWSTSWILRAIADNQTGSLTSFDLVDESKQFVPSGLQDQWELVQGDARKSTGHLPEEIGFLLLDSKHTYGFARWYFNEVIPRVKAGSPIAIHDISSGFKLPFANIWTGVNPPGTEAWKVRRELKKRDIGYYTLNSASGQGFINASIARLCRESIGIQGEFSASIRNPAVFFFAQEST